jgi:acetylornithine/N-succinyldiaminopimelate aminotransferase
MTHLWNVHERQNISFSHGEGVFLFSSNKKFLDFSSGGGVNFLGYNNQKLINAITKQAKGIWHLSNYHINKPAEKLAKKLCELSGFEKAFFVNSGTEGVEFALKVARKHFFSRKEERYEIISLKNGYHGRTMGSLSTSSNTKYTQGFGPLAGGFIHAEANLEDIEAKITNKTAAIIMESVQGNGGMFFLGWEFLKNIRALCDKHGILLILDEVFTGLGRLGKFFSYEYADIKPDIIVLAKGIAGGFPFGSVLSSATVASCINISEHGGTFGGNLLGIASAFEVIKEISKKSFLDNVNTSSKVLFEGLHNLQKLFPHIVDEIRGFGMMAGIKINDNFNTKELSLKMLKNHLIVGPTGGGTIRLTPPLIIKPENINLGLQAISSALSTIKL